MQAAALSKKQKLKTLAGRTQKIKKKVRKVLASNQLVNSFQGYALSEGESFIFLDKLYQFFPYHPLPVLKWSDLKTYSKEERRKLKKQVKDISPFQEYVVLGFNEVTRAMETKTASVVIISGDINPVILVKHFYQCCYLHKIPLLKIKNLRETTKKCFGISSMAMAFKKIPKDIALYEFYEFLEYSLPAEWERTRTNPIDANDYLSDISDEEQEPNDVPVETKNKRYEDEHIVAMEVDLKEEETKNVYLYRDNKDKRCFVPTPKKKEDSTFNADFVDFGEEGNELAEIIPYPKKQRKRKKKSKLKVKNLQANLKRKKAQGKLLR